MWLPDGGGPVADYNGGAYGKGGLDGGFALGIATPKAQMMQEPWGGGHHEHHSWTQPQASSGSWEPPDGEAIAAASAKAPPPLAAALGFFDQTPYWDGPSASSSSDGAAYQKAPVFQNAVSRGGKGPFDKGGKGEKGYAPPPGCVPPPPGGVSLAGRGMLVLPPTFLPPPIVGVAPPPNSGVVLPPPGYGKGGKLPSWTPVLPPGNGSIIGVSKASGCGPRVVLPPQLMSPNTAIGPDPGEQPEALPEDQDREGWLELLRDGFGKQFRCENDWQEPPPFHRALHFAAMPGEPCPKGKFPREALNLQLQLIFKARSAMHSELDGPPGAALMPAWPMGM